MAFQRPSSPAKKKRAFKDTRLCDYCGKEAKKKCNDCLCSIYCSRDCQKRDWRAFHKPLCMQLEQCRDAPLIDEYLSSMRTSPTNIGVATTQNHGLVAFCSEKKEWYSRTDADREVLLASTTKMKPKHIISMICDSILHPDYDNDLAGARRPDSVCLHSKSFKDDKLATKIANILTRLGIRVVDLDGESENRWCNQWLCVQKGWSDELTDEHFLDFVAEERRIPIEPNGQARKNVDFIERKIPRLHRSDFPTREEVLTLPFIGEEDSHRGLWIVCAGHRLFICYHGPDGFNLRFHREVALQPSRRPYPEDVLLCIQHVLFDDVKVRPNGAWFGQPSICSHNDVEQYENALDGSVIRGNLTLGAMNSMEGQLKGMLPHFYEAGILEEEDRRKRV